eukprot:9342551-Pyramimonas_sp.AAC.1
MGCCPPAWRLLTNGVTPAGVQALSVGLGPEHLVEGDELETPPSEVLPTFTDALLTTNAEGVSRWAGAGRAIQAGVRMQRNLRNSKSRKSSQKAGVGAGAGVGSVFFLRKP